MATFESIPILDYSLSRSPSTKQQFLDELKHALLQTGFLYLSNTGIDETLLFEVQGYCKRFFELPEEEKRRLEMKNSPHFLGYSRLGNEITKHCIDYREQIDLATELPAPSSSEPRYRQLRGPNQWPSESLIPGFRKTIETYIEQMTQLSTDFTALIAEAIGLPKDAFERFFEGIGESQSGTQRQDKLKLVKYPDMRELEMEGDAAQGDSMLSSYLLQVPPHDSLQVQNADGVWISCPPIANTFVVAMGQGLEAITGGVVASTTHRVLSPSAGEGPRYSIPFFQGVSYDAKFEAMTVPEDVKALKKQVVGGDVEMTFRKDMFERLGEATLANRVKSHTDVGEKWYPDILERLRKMGVAKDPSEKTSAQVEQAEQASAPILVVPTVEDASEGSEKPKGRRRAPTIVIDKIEEAPSYGEDPGPDGSLLRKEAYEKRKMDAEPDEVRYHSDAE
ncbi:Similar to 1-aminocyclopropane-1-carboxylate oxidase; acc. no. Q76NT9 [Pyronema omphalodes CBS 100304]|uniref:Similar to 1-aminocyclopropane-1-carboxylate oxidase acc. no. Q76NT9 n=1 Tax=Pyronema omphalodes (strain CBS 100304) TaxID=1076935 RepID=U4KXR2_PYROM|nr:Similar to 1-aminocyclopropane-1-carboxylate oxidase; acc. no. Q76NT9 [Pyronema omphalodes CBS 100304]